MAIAEKLRHPGHHKDPEKGDPDKEAQRNDGKEPAADDTDDNIEGSDEYDTLLKFIDREAERQRKHDEEAGDGEEKKMKKTRVWYMPWKVVEVEDDTEKTVPKNWMETDMTKGLDDSAITERRQKFGYNELESKKDNVFLKFIGYFRGPILYVMEVAVVLAAGLLDWIDLGVICAILLLNAFVGWYQEKQAGDIVEKLKAGIAMKATVVRGGKELEIDARDIVPGDICIVEEGQTIPADGRILASYDDKDGSKAKQILDKKQQSKEQKNKKGGNGAPPAPDIPANGTEERKEVPETSPDKPTGEDPNEKPTAGDHAPDKADDDRTSEDRKTSGDVHSDAEERPDVEGEKDDEDDKKGEKKDNEDDEDKGIDKGPSVLSVDQSAITGESLAVDKYVGDEVYYTCNTKRGKVYIVVINSAKQSFVGKTAGLVTNSSGTGHFQQVMNQIGTSLLILVIIWLFAVWIGGFFRGLNISTPQDNNLLIYSLIFFIIGVPVGLPCVTTTTMAVGAAYLAKQKAIVQKLTAIESLAGVDILCSDKTGTLTANKLSVHEPWACENVDVNWMLAVAVLASSHNIKALDPIDRVTIVTLKDYPKAREMLKGGWITHKFTPFDPVSKRITAEVEHDGKQYTCAKGAPNAILRLCKPPRELADQIRAKSQEFATRGFRTLGIAIQEKGQGWKMLGLLPMFDPPRSDTASTIAEAGQLGVRIKMLTGDAVAIAIETCKQLNLGTNVYDSQRLMSGGMAGSDLHNFVESADGFAEVTPENKYQVVEILQNRGHLTAMTGDGVNDAPSLKKADCGIAVEGASDAARSAADVVFLDEGLSTIITAIKVARQIFHRMKAYIVYRIALCLHLEIYLTISILVLNETVRSDLIVFIALFADLGTIAIAYDNAPFARAPVEWQLPKIWLISTVLGALLAAGTWVLRGTLFLSVSGDHGGIIQNWGSVQEILFLEIALTENWLILVTRGGGTLPSWQLVGALLAIDILASIFCIFGWISGTDPHNGHTDIVTVVRVWIFSFGVIIILALVYYMLNKITFLDNLGKSKRGTKREEYEDFIENLRRLTIVHEQDEADETGGVPSAASGQSKQASVRNGRRDVYHFQEDANEKVNSDEGNKEEKRK
ncbi:plasma-membrane proton-e [Calocera cornea HHB12733]|uniref:Plasma membrane ATPase n=1 Tax=Calocera cornea HHB12733 TaxID=1353952 RepID=A0A165IHH0_9BASI|nr:plasma-membrane proton-e [Calocera cornea HHB12733]